MSSFVGDSFVQRSSLELCDAERQFHSSFIVEIFSCQLWDKVKLNAHASSTCNHKNMVST